MPTWVFTIPYVEGGRDIKGADCWGLIILLYKHFYDEDLETYPEITLPSIKACREASEKLQKALLGQTQLSKVDTPQFGDAVLINVMGEPLHIGFCIDETQMIHTGKNHGVVIENFREMKWKTKISGFYRRT